MSDVRLIDANALKTEMADDLAATIRMPEMRKTDMAVRVLNKIDEAITIDAVPVVHGRWVREPRGIARCSYCDKGYRLTNGGANVLKFNYCPNCGARMDAKEAEHGQES